MLDPLQTPENETTGVALHIPLGARKVGHTLVTQVIDVKTKEVVSKTPAELERAVVAYPDQVKIGKTKSGITLKPLFPDVVVYDSDRSTAKRPWSEVDYVLPSAKQLFSISANMIPGAWLL